MAFPTETVYGLGARASDATAVARIFAAKGRPASVPVILHVTGLEQALSYVEQLPEYALAWGRRHWPGPLTIVGKRTSRVVDAVTAGGDWVGVRVPSHPVALALIEAVGEAIAAPSANPYGQLPPVRARHVMRGLGEKIDAVLDGGICPGGMESTVVRVGREATVLRRGAIAEARLGLRGDGTEQWQGALGDRGWLRVREFAGQGAVEAEFVAGERGTRYGRVRIGQGAAWEEDGAVVTVWMGRDPWEYCRRLYDTLHDLREAGCEVVWVEAPPRDKQWWAVWDRLCRLSWEVV